MCIDRRKSRWVSPQVSSLGVDPEIRKHEERALKETLLHSLEIEQSTLQAQFKQLGLGAAKMQSIKDRLRALGGRIETLKSELALKAA